MKKLYLVVFTFLLFVAAASAQRNVTGIVTDENGSPLIGAGVAVKGTQIGTITDFDGKFTLSIPASAEALVFSYVGYQETEVLVTASNVYNVQMAAGVILTETVVTALGISRQERSLGYAVESLEGSQIQQVGEVDPLRAMQGKVAGVNIGGSSGAPGSSTRITIRGNSSLLGNNQPLFIVDGIPYDNSEYRTGLQLSSGGAYGSRIQDIDPNNIESINILRGAAAAVLYGSRASNGAIVITTKTGSQARKKGLGVTLSSSLAFENIANLPVYQNTYGTGTGFNYQQANGSWGAPFIGAKPYATRDSIPHWYGNEVPEYRGINVPYRAYENNVRDLFRTGIVADNSITISGGDGVNSLTSTFSHVSNQGFVPNSKFDRFVFSVGGNTRIGERLLMGANISYSRSAQRGVLSGVGSSGANNPSAFARALYLGRNWDVQGQPYQNPHDNGSMFMVGRGQADNPLWSYENAGFESKVNRMAGGLNLSYGLLDWFSVNYRMGINAYDQGNLEFSRPGSTGPSDNPGLGSVIDHKISFQELESNFYLQANKRLADKIGLTAVLGHNANQRRYTQQAYRGVGYVVFNIDNTTNTNSVVPYNPGNGSNGLTMRRLVGLYADVTLDYDSWAYLNLAARNDWSSTLPVDNRSYFYPAVSGAVSLLDALKIENNTVDYVKLRAGWAQVGSDADPYLLRPVFLTNATLATSPAPTISFPFMGIPASTLSKQGRDPNLRPEITTEVELGTDIRLFRNRIGLSFTYYNRKTKDQIAPVSLPESSGFAQYITNFGVVSNKGVEVGLSIVPISRPNNGFVWDIYTTFTRNRNVVEELTDGVEEIIIEPGSNFAGSVSSVLRKGEQFGIFLGTTNARDEDGNLLINPANGQLIRNTEQSIIGNPNPDFIMGISNTFSWRNLTLGFVFEWRQGGDIYSNTVLSLLGRGVTKDTENREVNAIIPGVYGNPNTQQPYRDEAGNTIPNQTMIEVNDLYFGETFAINGANEWSVYDATVFRFREVTLGYHLPQRWMRNSRIQGAHISFSGRNLWFFAPGMPKYTNFDPEVNQFGASNKQGVEWGATPTVRRFAINLRLTF